MSRVAARLGQWKHHWFGIYINLWMFKTPRGYRSDVSVWLLPAYPRQMNILLRQYHKKKGQKIYLRFVTTDLKRKSIELIENNTW